MTHFALQSADLLSLGDECSQLCISLQLFDLSLAALEETIQRFEEDCLTLRLCADVKLAGIENWCSRSYTQHVQLYFSLVLLDADGSAEKGKGITSSGSDAYAQIWDIYASS